jgi:hypothetical protein
LIVACEKSAQSALGVGSTDEATGAEEVRRHKIGWLYLKEGALGEPEIDLLPVDLCCIGGKMLAENRICAGYAFKIGTGVVVLMSPLEKRLHAGIGVSPRKIKIFLSGLKGVEVLEGRHGPKIKGSVIGNTEVKIGDHGVYFTFDMWRKMFVTAISDEGEEGFAVTV